MNKHEYRLTWLFLLYGVIAVAGLTFGLPHIMERFAETNTALYSKEGLNPFQLILLSAIISHALIVFFAGVYSFIQKTTQHNLSLVAAISLLITFPIGTAIGIYYLWYRSKTHQLSNRPQYNL